MTEKKESDKAKTNGKPAAAAKPEAEAPKPPETGKFGKYIETLAIKSKALGNNAAGIEMIEVEAKDLVNICTQLKKNHGMTYLSNMTATEFKRGYQSAIQIENIDTKKYLIIKVMVDKKNPVVPTLTKIYPSADWLEREAWDMLGIKYDGHSNLTRILNPDDWEGHPLRKNYIGPIDALNEPLNYKGGKTLTAAAKN